MPSKGKEFEVFCKFCGRPRIVSEYLYRRSVNKIFFCDRVCQGAWKSANVRGKKHHAFSRVTVWCEWCGKEKEVSKADYDQHTHFFCNTKHQMAWRSKFEKGENSPLRGPRVTVHCAVCGKPRLVVPSVAEKHERHFCDRWCQGAWKSQHENGEKCHA